MNDNSYNGWTNYETWSWKLWIDNDQGTYQYWQGRVQDILSEEFKPRYEWETVDQLRRSMLADELKQDCEERLDFFAATDSGPFMDILNAGIGRIDWREISENMLSE